MIDFRKIPLAEIYEEIHLGMMTATDAIQLQQQAYEDRRGGYLSDLIGFPELWNKLQEIVDAGATA